MGVYTYLEKTLGITASRRLLEIRGKFEKKEELTPEEMIYLFNSTARFETLAARIREKDYKINEKYDENSYEIKELLGSVITELTNVHFMNIDDKRKYRVALSRTHVMGGRMSILDILSEINSGVNEVRQLQESFDFNNDNVQVVGTFTSLKNDYNVELSVTSDDKKEDVLEKVKVLIKESLEKEMSTLQTTLNQLD